MAYARDTSTWAWLTGAVAELQAANVDTEVASLAVLTSPVNNQAIANMVAVVGTDGQPLQRPPGRYETIPVLASSSWIPGTGGADDDAMWIGDWSTLWLAMRYGSIRLDILKDGTYGVAYQNGFRFVTRMDFAVTQPTAFLRIASTAT